MTAPVDPTTTAAWAELTTLHDGYTPDLKGAFAADAERAKRFTLDAADLHVDLSKNFLDDEILAALLKLANLAASTGEGNRLIDGGGVRVDSGVVSDKGLKLGAGTYVLQVGKRKFARVTLG